MMQQVFRQKYLHIGVIIFLSLSSFAICYVVFSKQGVYEPTLNSENTDKLSGETYYKQSTENENPYVPDFIGFSSIGSAGVSDYDMSYIYDVITNYVLYEKDIRKGKVSYVKDSFARGKSADDGYVAYSFKIGINNSDIHKINIRSSWTDERISVSIADNQGVVFEKDFSGEYLK